MGIIVAPRTWTPGETVTAAMLNAEIRDQMLALRPGGGSWDSYAPSWTASVSPSIGNGTLIGRKLEISDLVFFKIYLAMGSTTAYGSGGWSWSLPTSADATPTGVFGAGTLVARDVSAGVNYYGVAVLGTGNIVIAPAGVGSVSTFASTVPWTWAVGDTLAIQGWYQRA